MFSYACHVNDEDDYYIMDYYMSTEADVRYITDFLTLIRYHADRGGVSEKDIQKCWDDLQGLWLEYQMQVSDYIRHIMTPLNASEAIAHQLYILGILNDGGFWIEWSQYMPNLQKHHYVVRDGVIHYVLAIRPCANKKLELLTVCGEVNKEGLVLSTCVQKEGVEFLTVDLMKNTDNYKSDYKEEITQFLQSTAMRYEELVITFG